MKPYIYLLIVGLFIQCSSSPTPEQGMEDEPVISEKVSDIEEIDESSTIEEEPPMSGKAIKVKFTNPGDYYVLAASGLRMREGTSLDSEKMNVAEYGKKVNVIIDPQSESILVSGIKGRMLETSYNDKKGYMFGGYLSSIPVPKKSQNMKNYAKQLQQKGYDATYEYQDEKDDEEAGFVYMREIMTIPAKSFQEAFLIGKQLNSGFFNGVEFDLPNSSTPKSLTIKDENKIKKIKGIYSTIHCEQCYYFDYTALREYYGVESISIKYDHDELTEIEVNMQGEGSSASFSITKEGDFYTFVSYGAGG
ncbi:MAG: hypothetical protein ACJAUH_002730 [Saprospiraceae bacterium]|jgi:hypothetical protein